MKKFAILLFVLVLLAVAVSCTDSVIEDYKSPSCTEDGGYYIVTLGLGGREKKREYVSLPALGHNFDGGDICKRCGFDRLSLPPVVL